MKKMTMDRVSVLTVQYQQYSWEYMLDSFEKIGVKNIEMCPGEPHYCRLDYTSSGEAARRLTRCSSAFPLPAITSVSKGSSRLHRTSWQSGLT